MAAEILVSRQLRLCLQAGTDSTGKPIIKRKSFTSIDPASTTEQLVTTAKVIADLQVLPLLSIEHQELENLSE